MPPPRTVAIAVWALLAASAGASCGEDTCADCAPTGPGSGGSSSSSGTGMGGCTTDEECDGIVAGYCDQGSCHGKLSDGAICLNNNHCLSDRCVDGVCCDGGCTGMCESCAIEATVGVCTPLEAGSDPDMECGVGQTCDGAGSCVPSAWARRYGDAQYQSGPRAAFESNGKIVAAGTLNGTVDFGGGPLIGALGSSYLVELDALGNVLWQKLLGPPPAGAVSIDDVAVAPGGEVVVVGSLTGSVDFGGGALSSAGANDAFMAIFDAGGNHLHSAAWGDADSDNAHRVAVDPQTGDLVVLGSYQGGIDLGGGALPAAAAIDLWVARYTVGGAHLWSKGLGNALYDYPDDIAVHGDSVWVGGHFQGTIDFGGGPLSATALYDAFLVQLGVGGQHVWSNSWGTSDDDLVNALACDGDGNVVLVGRAGPAIDFGGGPLGGASLLHYVAALDPNGSHRFSLGIATTTGDALDVATDASGNVVIAGTFAGTIDVGGAMLSAPASVSDIYHAKLTASGAVSWARHYALSGSANSVRSVALNASGSSLLSGELDGSLDFGSSVIASQGSADLFLAKTAP